MKHRLSHAERIEYSYEIRINPADYCTRENKTCEDCSAVDVCSYRREIVNAVKTTLLKMKEEKDDGIRFNHRYDTR